MRFILRKFAPYVFNDGLKEINNLAKMLIKDCGGKDILDIGCGDGSLTMEFASSCGAVNISGIEIADACVKSAEARGIRCIKKDLNSDWNIAKESFDLIISSQNIEHIYNTRTYLKQAHDALKNNGSLIIITENLASWINISSLLMGWQPFSTTSICGWSIGNPLTWHRDLAKDESGPSYTESFGSHLRVLAYCGLKELLETTGFRKIEMYTRGYLPLRGSLSNILCKIDKRHGHFMIGLAKKTNAV